MNTISYVNDFFNSLEVWEDINNETKFKQDILESIMSFLDNPNVNNATKVYNAFFEAYWMGTQGEINPFLELVKKINLYEENAGRLLIKHRDHYIHSVNVFILGICIFTKNTALRDMIDNVILDKNVYKQSYDTRYEEFFYRWGLASLFHDIAYPIEISIGQVNSYLSFLSDYSLENNKDNHARVDLPILKKLVKLPLLEPHFELEKEFYNYYPSLKNKDILIDATMLLAKKLSNTYDISFSKVKSDLQNFTIKMNDYGFIDHGYFSALIILSWYNYLINSTKWNPAYFYFPVLDSASAILLHNYYKQVLMKSPFNLGKITPIRHPIAYLLILCDELQDWGRKSYGLDDKEINLPHSSEITISSSKLRVKYYFNLGADANQFLDKKIGSLNSLIDTTGILNEGIDIKCEYKITLRGLKLWLKEKFV